MGIISSIDLELYTSLKNMMKLCLLAVALVAGVIAEPESKPYHSYGGLYGGYGYGGYGGYGHYLGKRSADAEPYYGGLYGGYGYGGYGGYGHYLGKRSADAEPESKPYYAYGGLYG